MKQIHLLQKVHDIINDRNFDQSEWGNEKQHNPCFGGIVIEPGHKMCLGSWITSVAAPKHKMVMTPQHSFDSAKTMLGITNEQAEVLFSNLKDCAQHYKQIQRRFGIKIGTPPYSNKTMNAEQIKALIRALIQNTKEQNES